MIYPAARLLLLLVLLAIITFAVVLIVEHHDRTGPPRPGRYELLPAPWLIPKQAGGTALRLAMVHDVLHERFHLHGPAWFEHRHRQVERELATYEDGTKPKDARYFALLDDYAVDFDRLGRPAEGIPILRRKLDLQQPPDADGKRAKPDPRFYTTYANLGTLLAHEHLKGALKKDPTALAGLREGLALIEQSVAVNPDAHFGRERWQMVTLRYLLHASEDPEWLTTCDLMGVSWDADEYVGRGGHAFATLTRIRDDDALRKRLVEGPRTDEDQSLVKNLRRTIPPVISMDRAWGERCAHDFSLPATFDEPALAFVGIWTLGSGANPHFSLALAHLMEGMGQWSIAWNAYERTRDLAGKFWSDPALQRKLVDHCTARQTSLEGRRLKESADTLRERHQRELAYGRAEQAAYQTYEAERIAAGHDPVSPGFYDDFYRGRAPIASDAGEADTIVRKLPADRWVVVLWVQAVFCSILALLLLSDVLKRRKELAA